MAARLPSPSPDSGGTSGSTARPAEEATGGTTDSANTGTNGDRQELGPVCSGALALRRITSLLSSARKADAKGDRASAREQYTEVLKIQQSLARAPLGSIGKSLQEACVWVEKRLEYFARKEARDGNGTTRGGPTSSTSPSVRASTTDINPNGERPQEQERRFSSEELPPRAPRQSTWDQEASKSARGDGSGGRPSTRDGTARPNTQEGGRRTAPSDRRELGGLGDTRPATREEARLQRQIGGRPGSKSGKKSSPRDAVSRDAGSRPSPRDGFVQASPRDGPARTPRDGAVRTPRETKRREASPQLSSKKSQPRTGLSKTSTQRPPTSEGIARPPTRDGPGDRRCHDVTIRRTGKNVQRGFDMDVAVPAASPSRGPSKSPGSSSDSDASVDFM